MSNIVLENENVYVEEHFVDDKKYFITKFRKLDELNVEHGFYSSKDINFDIGHHYQNDSLEFKELCKKLGLSLDTVLIKLQHGNLIVNLDEYSNEQLEKIKKERQRVLVDGIRTTKSYPLYSTAGDCIRKHSL